MKINNVRIIAAMRSWRHVLLYILCTMLANILAARWTVKLPLGLYVPSGVFMIAPIFSLRDAIHERFGRRVAYISIVVSSVLSLLYSVAVGSSPLSRITFASFIAFVFNESVDTEIYHKLRNRSVIAAIIFSNAVSSMIDSVLFIWVAFGLLPNMIAGQYIVKMFISTLVGIWITKKR